MHHRMHPCKKHAFTKFFFFYIKISGYAVFAPPFRIAFCAALQSPSRHLYCIHTHRSRDTCGQTTPTTRRAAIAIAREEQPFVAICDRIVRPRHGSANGLRQNGRRGAADRCVA